MKLIKRQQVLIIFVVVVLMAIIIGGTLGWIKWNRGTSYSSPVPVVNGFPKELLLDDQGVVIQSYSSPVSATSTQYIVQWHSPKSPQSVFGLYEAYFKNNGWTVGAESKDSQVESIYATNNDGVVNFTITSSVQGTLGTVVYEPQSAPAVQKPVLPVGYPSFLIPGTSTLISVAGNEKSNQVVFIAQTSPSTLSQSLLAYLAGHGWTVSQKTISSDSGYLSAYSADLFLSVTMQVLPSSELLQVETRYQNLK